MEFLTSHQKKKKARRLYSGYLLLSVLVLLATYVLVSTALGFEIFSSKGQVIQNGLLFIDSRPDNAEIYINDKKESSNTNAKLTVPESTYTVKLKKTGYREWDGYVSLVGGTVEFLTYPRLLPLVPKVLSSNVLSSEPVAMQSRDKRWVVSYLSESPSQITVSDLDKPSDPATILVLPESVTLGKAVQSLKFIEWAGDNEHFMFSVSLSDIPTSQYVVMNRQKPGEISNVSAMFGLSAGDTVGFWDAKRDQVYVRQPSGVIRLGSLKDSTLTVQPLFSDLSIEFFAISKERALYTTKLGDELLVKYYQDGKTHTVTVAKDPSMPVIAKSFDFNRNNYILVAGEGFDKTLLFRNFESSISKSVTGRVAPFFTMPSASKVADVSKSSRLVMGSDGNNVQIYDIEQKEYLKYELPTPKPAEIGWFDDTRLYALGSDSSLNVLDFTGRNVYQLATDTVGKPLVNGDVNNAQYVSKTNGQFTNYILDIESATE